MLPTITVFNKTIAMYGLMILVGIFVGISIATLRRRKYNLSSDDVLFASCYGGIGLLIGAKLLYLITTIPNLFKYRVQIFSNYKILLSILSSGFVFYGGLIGAIIGYIIYCRQFKVNLINMLDLIAPSIPLIHGFGRIGCFMAGCCYGIDYEGPLHVIFHNSVAAPVDVPLLPIQLIESALNFLAALALIIYARRLHRSGQVLSLYLIYYSIARFFLEFYRGDITRGSFMNISTSQWISFPILLVGLILFFSPKVPRLYKYK